MSKVESTEETTEVINCDVCLKEIPAEAEEYQETDDYVRHFCGIECYSKWKKDTEAGQ